MVMTKQKKQQTRQSSRVDDVFKVKNKIKKQNKGKAIKSKSVSKARGTVVNLCNPTLNLVSD